MLAKVRALASRNDPRLTERLKLTFFLARSPEAPRTVTFQHHGERDSVMSANPRPRDPEQGPPDFEDRSEFRNP